MSKAFLALYRFIVCSTSMLLSDYVAMLRPGCPQPRRLPCLWLPFWLIWSLTTFRQAASVCRQQAYFVCVAAALAPLLPHNLQASSLCLPSDFISTLIDQS